VAGANEGWTVVGGWRTDTSTVRTSDFRGAARRDGAPRCQSRRIVTFRAGSLAISAAVKRSVTHCLREKRRVWSV